MDNQATNPTSSVPELHLYGKVVVKAVLVARSGLVIGAAQGGVNIGGVDKFIIRNPLNNEPYVPGSSVKGKMRSLSERAHGSQADEVVTKASNPKIAMFYHLDVFTVFGFADSLRNQSTGGGRQHQTTPTRLIVRDSFLTSASREVLSGLELDQPYAEVKTEVGIDRITSAANPRTIERVPAGARFRFSLSYSVLTAGDVARFGYVLEAMRLLEDDYLGGNGSRGSGQIAFTALQLRWRSADYYRNAGKDDDILAQTGAQPQAEDGSVGRRPRLANLSAEQIGSIIERLGELRQTSEAALKAAVEARAARERSAGNGDNAAGQAQA